MVRRPEAWPGTVIPGTPEERAAASALLFRRMQQVTVELTQSERAEVERTLEFWFDHGYCVEALLLALGRDPGDQWQPPQHHGESLPRYLTSRLSRWLDEDAATPRPAPRQGMTYERWVELDRQRRLDNQPRYTRPQLSKEGQRARSAARDRAQPSAPPDPIARLRERSKRRVAALDSLLLPGVAPAPVVIVAPPAPPEAMATSRLVATFDARRAVIARNPQIRRILARLRAERRAPTQEERAVLDNALRAASRNAARAALEAVSADLNEDETRLSDEAHVMLDHLHGASTPEWSWDTTIEVPDTRPADTQPPSGTD